MKKVFLFVATVSFLLCVACQPNKAKRVEEITKCEAELLSQPGSINEEKAKQMVSLFSQFATDFPKDSLAPVFLCKAADISMNLGNDQAALDFLNKITEQYTSFDKIAECYFFKGFIYESMNNTAKAGEAYKVLIEKYPAHPLAHDAQFSIDNLGVSPEELIKRFEQADSIGQLTVNN